MQRRWIQRALIVFVTAAVVAPTAAYATHLFDDVEDDNVHAPGISYVLEKEITSGCNADSYCPDNPVTRAQMATFLYRSSGNAPDIDPSVNADTVDGLDSTELMGSSGITGVHEVFELGVLDSTSRKGAQVMCPEGEVALGGGHNLGRTADPTTVAIHMSLPITDPDGVPRGWQMDAEEVVPTDASWRPVVTVICAPAG